jgi:phosphoribosylglycinamide formyltransferase-1
MDHKKRILVFASGTAVGGGVGFATMVEKSRGEDPILDAEIVAVVSNHKNGGVAQKARTLDVPFEYWNGPFCAEFYHKLAIQYRADYVVLSGWLKKVSGLPMDRTINIHPGPLPFSAGLYGMLLHQYVLDAYMKGAIGCSAVTMEFVNTNPNDRYDTGKVIFEKEVKILPDDTPESLSKRVKKVELEYQSRVINKIIHGKLSFADLDE